MKDLTIQKICEKMGFRVLEGSLDLEEKWIGQSTIKFTGTGEMEASGAVLTAPLTIHVEIGSDFKLDISGQRVTGRAA